MKYLYTVSKSRMQSCPVSPGDGSIDETEFSKVCGSHGVEEAEAREAFKKLQVVSVNQAGEK